MVERVQQEGHVPSVDNLCEKYQIPRTLLDSWLEVYEEHRNEDSFAKRYSSTSYKSYKVRHLRDGPEADVSPFCRLLEARVAQERNRKLHAEGLVAVKQEGSLEVKKEE